jgi:hypothetical protein
MVEDSVGSAGGPAPARDRPAEQLTWAARHDRLHTTRLLPNRDCRFDHRRLVAEPLAFHPLRSSLDLPAPLATLSPADRRAVTVGIDGCGFCPSLRCHACGAESGGWRLVRPSGGCGVRCRCGGDFQAGAFDTVSDVPLAALDTGPRRPTLGTVGLRAGDLVTLRAGGIVCHAELRARRRRDG